jgi:hypothetical protein
VLRAPFVALWLIVGATTLGACEASMNADVKAGGSAEVNDFDKPLESDEASPRLAEAPASAAPEYALLGARHDLKLASAGREPSCRCLTTALGLPSAPGMVWRGEAPNIDPNTQLVVALSSAGTSCEGEPKGSLGASYWGYKQVGSDVIVIVEAAREGRPLTEGGIIPKPAGDGQVYVEPLSPNLPYAKAESSGPGGKKQRCGLGNPGPTRAVATETPPTPDSPQP